MLDPSESLRLLVLSLISRKKVIASSYFLNQIFQNIGIFESVEKCVLSYAEEGLLKHDGYFEGSTGLLKNIQLTDKGYSLVEEDRKNINLEEIQRHFGDNSIINSLFA
jgi:hypothetical protein